MRIIFIEPFPLLCDDGLVNVKDKDPSIEAKVASDAMRFRDSSYPGANLDASGRSSKFISAEPIAQDFPDCMFCAPCRCDDECDCIPGPCPMCRHSVQPEAKILSEIFSIIAEDSDALQDDRTEPVLPSMQQGEAHLQGLVAPMGLGKVRVLPAEARKVVERAFNADFSSKYAKKGMGTGA